MWVIEAYDKEGIRLPGRLATNCDVMAANMIQRLGRTPTVSMIVATYQVSASMFSSAVVIESGWFVHKDERRC